MDLSLTVDTIAPENYQRAFFFKNLGYLVMDIVLAHYKKRDFLAIYNDGMLGTYISTAAAQKAGQLGKELFSSEEEFEKFERDFRAVIIKSRAYIAKATKLESVTFENLLSLHAMVLELYDFFEKTEFFFTDESYQGAMSDVLKKNLLVLGEDLKMESRPLFVELISTVLYHYVDLVSVQFDVNPEDLKFYSLDEMRNLFESTAMVKGGTLDERKGSYVLYCKDNVIIPLVGEEKELVLERFKEIDYSNITNFKGTVANKGRVVGRARVILPELNVPYAEFVKKLHALEMSVGDILVTETTSPDFVPLMKKAGGIIANQGGLNSHAAIMSRELKIPCLVGTYHATEILRTGDLIELDADKGVVRIIK
jgi:phosphoenolpyruvate synthase/pyruvate phosphate dikinase